MGKIDQNGGGGGGGGGGVTRCRLQHQKLGDEHSHISDWKTQSENEIDIEISRRNSTKETCAVHWNI